MSIVTEFTLPAEAFALEETFETIPNLTIEIERLATHSREWVMPFLWATADDLEAAKAAIRADSSVTEVNTVDRTGNVGYFNVHWTERVQELIDQVVDQHGIVQEAAATNGTWYLKLQFVGQGRLESFQHYFDERGYSFELQRLYEVTDPKEREYDLTPQQREAMVTALEMGYFAVPRETQIAELADALDISTNAVSQRLRRATNNLTRNTLTVSSERAEDLERS
ncbi:helix-turn-helix domain-containing protein [Natronosalvus halobius]|uniref:helix-turn-helix domain-containing protein n=1 Tax=Natronosalvus halobius TaxID=2953746 RepID=UPI00209ED54C|nr:helix-turn-helix domain-containing protein [Natronosalvus halobius]USZ70984.1 helix-turn-helix domain-containing protein [Natronosalvus halobius]